ncbi:alanine racemase [Rhodococcus sp. 14-2470-1b]|uniref:alanine racemase n=1 Tax=Rhodococcus sp. 14-2470-1b TaxID=2023149 RepID=UPI000B9BB226|nr:alanine racemase [Rhodococcus sp. 14-2470-1b]OZF58129.1 alanine racemase [Rhodococcus sp. 14-2470-1b]
MRDRSQISTDPMHDRRAVVALSGAVDNVSASTVDAEGADTGAGGSVTIDLAAITHNVRVLREHAENAATMVVVKADGYNHGAVQVARTALAAGASELGVTTVGEGIALRDAGITAPILSWLHRSDTDFAPALTAGIGIGVSSRAQLDSVVDAARRVGTTAAVTLKVDTGLNRNGIEPQGLDEVFTVLGGAVAEGSVHFRGMFSHLACADEPGHPLNDQQAMVLQESVVRAAAAGVRPEIVHLANSAATVTRHDLRFDMVRPGIAMYGLSPIPELGQFGLIPAMTVSAQVALIKKVRAGDSVSYGHTWTSPEDTVVALIPMGYADGVRRSLSGRFDVTINGRRYPSVGRVCMDQFVVNLGPDGGSVVEGDTAVLFGSGDNDGPVAQEWADVLDTIHYEVVTGIGGRARRRYVESESASTDRRDADTTEEVAR